MRARREKRESRHPTQVHCTLKDSGTPADLPLLNVDLPASNLGLGRNACSLNSRCSQAPKADEKFI
jgi:hypothetical protein